MNLITQPLIALLVAIALPLYASELEPLKQFVNRKPLFISDRMDAQFVAMRCSALYIVLSLRAEESSKEKDLQVIAKDYGDKAVIYDQVRDIFFKATNSTEISSKNRQNAFAKRYADITLNNWKQSGDLFKGIVTEDLDVCDENYPYFKKLATNLSNDIKK